MSKTPAFFCHRWLIHICRILLGLIFIAASIGKILDIAQFTSALAAYQLVPAPLLIPFGHFLPWLEFTVGLGLLIDRWPKGATLLANLMLLLFIAVIAITMLRGIKIECGCFAIITGDTLAKTLIRDLLFMIPALILLRYHRSVALDSKEVGF